MASVSRAPAKAHETPVLDVTIAVAFILGLTGCAAVNELTALRRVNFSLDRVDNVRLAGVRIDDKRSYSDLSVADASRIGAAIVANEAPLDLVLHVRADNLKDNAADARLVDLDWTLFLEDKETVSGKLAGTTYLLPRGEPVDVPLGAHLDLLKFFGGSGRDLFDLALAFAGQGGATKEVRLEALPTIQTSLGPIQYPGRIVIRREVGR